MENAGIVTRRSRRIHSRVGPSAKDNSWNSSAVSRSAAHHSHRRPAAVARTNTPVAPTAKMTSKAGITLRAYTATDRRTQLANRFTPSSEFRL